MVVNNSYLKIVLILFIAVSVYSGNADEDFVQAGSADFKAVYGHSSIDKLLQDILWRCIAIEKEFGIFVPLAAFGYSF